jgi:parallel beta-helix repeat protein
MKRFALAGALLGAIGLAVAGIASAGANTGTMTFGQCGFTVKNATWTLNADCTTDRTISVPDGFTLNGANHTITVSGAFNGAVVQNAVGGTVMNVQNLTITGDKAPMAENCARVFNGVAFMAASGSISGVTLNNIGLPETGCQVGRAILVDSIGAPTRQSVTIQGNTVTNYNKNGIDVRGNVDATIKGNTVSTSASDQIIRNGIVVRTDASADVWANTVSGNKSTAYPQSASGLLVTDNGTVNMTKGQNTLSNNDVPLYNDGSTVVSKWVSP